MTIFSILAFFYLILNSVMAGKIPSDIFIRSRLDSNCCACSWSSSAAERRAELLSRKNRKIFNFHFSCVSFLRCESSSEFSHQERKNSRKCLWVCMFLPFFLFLGSRERFLTKFSLRLFGIRGKISLRKFFASTNLNWESFNWFHCSRLEGFEALNSNHQSDLVAREKVCENSGAWMKWKDSKI